LPRRSDACLSDIARPVLDRDSHAISECEARFTHAPVGRVRACRFCCDPSPTRIVSSTSHAFHRERQRNRRSTPEALRRITSRDTIVLSRALSRVGDTLVRLEANGDTCVESNALRRSSASAPGMLSLSMERVATCCSRCGSARDRSRSTARTRRDGAVRKSRLTLGDRVTIAIEYRARDVGKASGRASRESRRPGAKIQERRDDGNRRGDCGTQVLVAGDTLPGVASVTTSAS